jgi:hypothetical protein
MGIKKLLGIQKPKSNSSLDYKGEVRHILKASYQKGKERDDSIAKAGFTKDARSNKNTLVLQKNGKPYVVHRGSVTAKDWFDDAVIAAGFGKYTSRVKKSKKLTKELERESGQKVTHAGHSLGGAIASLSAGKDNEVITYNRHAVGLAGRGKSKKETDFRTPGDLASIGKVFKKGSNVVETVGKNKAQNYVNPLYAHHIQ